MGACLTWLPHTCMHCARIGAARQQIQGTTAVHHTQYAVATQRVNDSLQRDVRKLHSKVRRAEDAAEDAVTKLQAAQHVQQPQPQPQPQPQHEELLDSRAVTPEQQQPPVLVTAGVQKESTWQAERQSLAPQGEQAGLGTAQKGTLDSLAAHGGQAPQMLDSSGDVRDAQLGQAPGQQDVHGSAQETTLSLEGQPKGRATVHTDLRGTGPPVGGYTSSADTNLQQGNAEAAASLARQQQDQSPILPSAKLASVEPALVAITPLAAGAIQDVATAGTLMGQAATWGEVAILR